MGRSLYDCALFYFILIKGGHQYEKNLDLMSCAAACFFAAEVTLFITVVTTSLLCTKLRRIYYEKIRNNRV
jgi:hypothetical protein